MLLSHLSLSGLVKDENIRPFLDEVRGLSDKNFEQLWPRDRLGDGSLNNCEIGWVGSEYNARNSAGHSNDLPLGGILRFLKENLTIMVLCNEQRFYPYLAKGISNFYFSPAPVEKVKDIADTDTEMTRVANRFFADRMRHKADPSLSNEKSRQ